MPLPIVGGLIELGKTVANRVGEVRQAKHERKLKEITGEIDVQKARISEMSTSWKDEYLAVLISLPFILVFYYALINDPTGIERVKTAFQAMNELPEWYRWAFLGIIGGVFGLRGLSKFVKK